MEVHVPVAADVLAESHWWDEHPPANPEAEPLYAEALEGHLTVLSLF